MSAEKSFQHRGHFLTLRTEIPPDPVYFYCMTADSRKFDEPVHHSGTDMHTSFCRDHILNKYIHQVFGFAHAYELRKKYWGPTGKVLLTFIFQPR